MWRVITILGFLISLFSTLRLIRLGFTVSFVEPFRVMLDWYQATLELLLGWADPLLKQFLKSMRAWLPIDLPIYPHWKHIFVLMWLYVAGDFKQYWVRGRTISGPVVLLLGGIVSLVASVASATVPLDSPSMLPVIFFVGAFAFYEAINALQSATFHRRSGESWWQTCRYYLLNFAFVDAAIGAIIVAVGWVLRSFQMPPPNLVLLMAFVIAMALRNVALGASVAQLTRREGGTWTGRYMKSATGRLGVMILKVAAAAVVVVAFNAGLS